MKTDNINLENFKDNDEAFILEHVLKYTNQSVFLTGRAGTGKSTLINLLIKDLKKNVIRLAPTGIAAKNIGGQTIHSFFKLPLELKFHDSKEIKEINYSEGQKRLINETDIFIIDEVSMVSSILLDCIDSILKRTTNSFKRFEGKQIVLIGDPYQLPPVVEDNNSLLIKHNYKSRYFFDSKSFRENYFLIIELKECYRQNDQYFMEILDKIKVGNISQSELNELNKLCLNDNYKKVLTLSPYNDVVNEVNDLELNRLKGKTYKFNALVEGNFNEKDCLAPFVLNLKIGAKIMFIKNNSGYGYVNGTLGVVKDLEENKIIVETDENKIIEVSQSEWTNEKYNNEGQLQTLGILKQYPLLLAWGITVHKSQGMTLSEMHFDIGKGTFTHGQAYVALSRCKSIENLSLSKVLSLNDIKIDEKVSNFYKSISSNEQNKLLYEILDTIMKDPVFKKECA